MIQATLKRTLILKLFVFCSALAAAVMTLGYVVSVAMMDLGGATQLVTDPRPDSAANQAALISAIVAIICAYQVFHNVELLRAASAELRAQRTLSAAGYAANLIVVGDFDFLEPSSDLSNLIEDDVQLPSWDDEEEPERLQMPSYKSSVATTILG